MNGDAKWANNSDMYKTEFMKVVKKRDIEKLIKEGYTSEKAYNKLYADYVKKKEGPKKIKIDLEGRKKWPEFAATEEAQDYFLSTLDEKEGLEYFYGQIGNNLNISKKKMEAILDDFISVKKAEFMNKIPNDPKIHALFKKYLDAKK